MRYITAAVMAFLYVLILTGPLAPLAAHSAGGAPSQARECSGDCNICGCSPESRAARTCCCSRKNQQQAHLHSEADVDEPECCRKEHEAGKKETVIACGCPCGGDRQSALSSGGTSEVMPFQFTESFTPAYNGTRFSPFSRNLTSRHSDPPDPPPQNC